jgi:predicted nucleic acid-binding protein
MKYLLDSSAWLAHLFGEPGMDEVNQLFDDPHAEVSIAVLSIPEIYARMKALGRQADWRTVWDIYLPLFTQVIPTSEAIAHQAVSLRAATPERLPTIDGLIAATAVIQAMTLVHRDPHIAAIPSQFLQQLKLPEK